MLEVCLLGTGGMMPLPNRFLTSLAARLNGKMLIIDSGEGTQITLKLLGWGFKNIDIICITHFHADHISGLPGLLLTIGNSGRDEPLNIIGPKGLGRILSGLLLIAPELPFEIIVHELPSVKTENILMCGYEIGALPVSHGIPCFAYSLSVKRSGKFDPDRAEALGLPKKFWNILQKGQAIGYQGDEYTPDMVMGPDRDGIKVSYCTDSRPVSSMREFFSGSDLLICEGIYGDDEKFEKAAAHNHMIFKEAAVLARDAGVKELWLTHYSPALLNPFEFLNCAKDIFENTVAGYDRLTKKLLFPEQS